MAKQIEEYIARGTYNDIEPLNLRTTVYPQPLKKNHDKISITTKIISVAMTIVLSVGIAIPIANIDNGSAKEPISNDSPEPELEASVENPIEIEFIEDTVEVPYKVVYGDNLTKIVKRYIKGSDTDVANEMVKICANAENNQKIDDILPEGKTLYLCVPVSMAKDYGYGYKYEEVTEKEQMEHFIFEAFKSRKQAGVHPDAQHSFVADEEYAIGQIHAAGRITADIEEVYEPNPATYSIEFIEGKRAEIITILKDAVIFTEGATSYTYLQDFVLAPKAIAIPLNPSLTT